MTYTKQHLLGEIPLNEYSGKLVREISTAAGKLNSEQSYQLAGKVCFDLVKAQPKAFIVLRFEDAPKFLISFCNFNGGDEDWMAITHKSNYENNYVSWVERMDSCSEPDIYEIGDYLVFVGSHA